ncbi:bifunctional serine/threonine-protein kinase/ABC transporter substrate-binding protein [Streptomyces sp. RFCAC02]|uniref:bifunctional serine/threonine-protein kinase/ABC transporter substrate-binding protein n=1 Tax=Streptomyces sp. RFCAC02 TaxID=2499143 RepID=UPI001F0E7D9F|nr:bifunctional serine/threonine-protein kinase/ABC transporter substrate-binding protein [Streptomyces sp. RFCAC02]
MSGSGDRIGPLRPQDPTEIAGFRLRGRLGTGGMGTVYLAESGGGRLVALKVVHAQLGEDPVFRRRFEHEIRAAGSVRGRYVVPVLGSDTEGPVPWLATAYVPGPSLSAAVNARGPLPPAAVVRLIAGMAHALDAMHAGGVIHRDLKPGNVMLADDGPAVIDFGIARAADATALTSTGVRVGTPAFMAPEQIEGGAPVTAAVDVFALGLTAHFAATGAHPYGEGATSALLYRIVNGRPDLSACPPALRGLIGDCLAKDPAARPTPARIAEACRGIGAALGVGDPLPGPGWLTDVSRAPTVPGTSPGLPPHVPPHIMSAPDPAPLTALRRDGTPGTGGRRRGRVTGWIVASSVLLVGAIVAGIALLPDGGGGGDDGTGTGGTADGGATIGVLLADDTTRTWSADRAYLEERIAVLCPDCAVRTSHAGGGADVQRQQFEELLDGGADAIVLEAVDVSATSEWVADARARDVPVVSYDRPAGGPVAAHVGYDMERVGEVQGEALLDALGERADGGRVVMINGAPADPAAEALGSGTRAALDGTADVVDERGVDGWQPSAAREAMYTAIQAVGVDGFDAVSVANEALAAEVILALEDVGVDVPVGGQDADVNALQRLIDGRQTFTVYKSPKQEAETAAEIAVRLARDEAVDDLTPDRLDDTPATLLTPVAVTAGTIAETVVADGYFTTYDICVPRLTEACADVGLT